MVDIGIIETLLHPPIGSLEEVFDTRSPWVAGSHSIGVTHTGTPVSDTYGCILTASLKPLNWGYQVGYADLGEGLDARRFVPWWAQLVFVHRLLSGAPVFSQLVYVDQQIAILLPTNANPSLVGLYIQPGFEADLYWLRLL